MTTRTRKTSLAVVASDQPPGPAALRQMQGRGLWVLDAAKRLSASLSRRSTLSLLDVELADSTAVNLLCVRRARHRIVPREGYVMPPGFQPAFVVERDEAFNGTWSPAAVVLRSAASADDPPPYPPSLTPEALATLIERLPDIVSQVELLTCHLSPPTVRTAIPGPVFAAAEELRRLLGIAPT